MAAFFTMRVLAAHTTRGASWMALWALTCGTLATPFQFTDHFV